MVSEFLRNENFSLNARSNTFKRAVPQNVSEQTRNAKEYQGMIDSLMTVQWISQIQPKRPFGHFLSPFLTWGRLALFRAKTLSLHNDSVRPLFKQIYTFSGILTAYFKSLRGNKVGMCEILTAIERLKSPVIGCPNNFIIDLRSDIV